MGRRKNNPELVNELIDERWTMDDNEFEEKFETLSLDDKCKVAKVINNMEDELMNSFDED